MAITRRLVLKNVNGTPAPDPAAAFEPADASVLTVYIQSGAGVSAGGIAVDEGPSKDGPWIALGVEMVVPAAGQVIAYRPKDTTYAGSPVTAYGALRLRVNTTIVGGTINAWIVAG